MKDKEARCQIEHLQADVRGLRKDKKDLTQRVNALVKLLEREGLAKEEWDRRFRPLGIDRVHFKRMPKLTALIVIAHKFEGLESTVKEILKFFHLEWFMEPARIGLRKEDKDDG